MTAPSAVHFTSSSSSTPTHTNDHLTAVLHVMDGEKLLIKSLSGQILHPRAESFAPGGLSRWLPAAISSEYMENRIQAALAAREAAVTETDTTRLALFGQHILGLNRSARWTEALSTALLGNWIAPLHDGTGLCMLALGQLRREARTIHRQLLPLWQRRTSGNRRVLLLEKPSAGGGTLRDLLADRHLPEDPLLDQVPGDRRLAAVLQRLAPAERDVVLALGHPGVATWAQAAELAGADRPTAVGERVRRKVRATVTELQRRDQQRIDGPTGLWAPVQSSGA
ncbi:hypothetical protein ACFRKE_01090 [Kitasatospora indigofera]|uniref:hypothetical protein n=1 Tax=Kitasatospora indigofera TaxID=67307 RepID=UPI0036D062EC